MQQKTAHTRDVHMKLKLNRELDRMCAAECGCADADGWKGGIECALPTSVGAAGVRNSQIAQATVRWDGHATTWFALADANEEQGGQSSAGVSGAGHHDASRDHGCS